MDDVNDNYPEITLTPTTISINESEFVKLPFDTFVINDIDLGPHATFDVVLTEEENALEVYSSAFNIIPNSGYQLTPFSINVLNAELLDYEEPNWQNFTITVSSITHEERLETLQILSIADNCHRVGCNPLEAAEFHNSADQSQ